jgi:glycerophosphoryl diester phosphodiesterase
MLILTLCIFLNGVYMSFMNIAHRGLSSQFPENTLLAFQKALDIGIDWMEFDLQITSDGHLVVMHDKTVDRTTNGSGLVSDLTLSQVLTLDAGAHLGAQFAGEGVPTFEAVLDLLAGKAKMAVELKFEGLEPIAQVLDILENRNLMDQVSISSFDLNKLPEVKRLCSACSTTALVKPGKDLSIHWVKEVQKYGADVFGPLHADTTQEMVDMAHDEGLVVRCWGLGKDQGPALERMIDLGVDGMTTDCPDVLQGILKRRQMVS